MNNKKRLIYAACLPLGALLPGFGAVALAATAPQFQSHVEYPVGLAPAGARMEDLNYDGHLDVVTANGGADTVSVLLGKGDGTFQPKADYPVGGNPQGVQVGDLNRDGNLDLVVTNFGQEGAWGSTVSVLLGKGDGAFKAKQDHTVGSAPWGAQIGDLNRDGLPDIATANYLSSSVSVLFGKAGGFRPKVDLPTDFTPRDVQIGDLNRDGKPDLATANYGGGSGLTASLLLGKGNGRFFAAVNHAVREGPTSLQFGDFNRDGKPDLAVTSHTDPSPTVTVLLGGGFGGFASQVDYSMSGRNSLQTRDLNRDGWLDFAAVDWGGVSLLLSDGAGGFQAPQNYPTDAGATGLQIGDLNHDGKLDLVTANSAGNTVSVLLGK